MGGSTAQRRSNLPAELSSFVGRRHELASVRTGLATHRLVTLRGPGGIGKTRLAYRTAADQERSLADGAWVAELAPVHAPELVPETVVGALGIRSAEGGSPTERLVAHLRDRELLLVLDNCEHVQEAAAALASELLADLELVPFTELTAGKEEFGEHHRGRSEGAVGPFECGLQPEATIEVIVRTSCCVPRPRRGAQLALDDQIGARLLQPDRELRPGAEDDFMDDLDGLVGADDETRRHQ